MRRPGPELFVRHGAVGAGTTLIDAVEYQLTLAGHEHPGGRAEVAALALWCDRHQAALNLHSSLCTVVGPLPCL